MALATPESRAEFAASHGIGEAELEAAVRAGVKRGIDDAEAAGALNRFATGLRAIAARLPVDEAVAYRGWQPAVRRRRQYYDQLGVIGLKEQRAGKWGAKGGLHGHSHRRHEARHPEAAVDELVDRVKAIVVIEIHGARAVVSPAYDDGTLSEADVIGARSGRGSPASRRGPTGG